MLYICCTMYNKCITMRTEIIKKQTAFRLNANLLDILKEKAKMANRSLSNYVECILMDSVYNEPNETTLDAIKEAREGKSAGIVDISSVDAFYKSLQ